MTPIWPAGPACTGPPGVPHGARVGVRLGRVRAGARPPLGGVGLDGHMDALDVLNVLDHLNVLNDLSVCWMIQ